MHANHFKPSTSNAGERQLLRGHLSNQASDDFNHPAQGTRRLRTPDDVIAADQSRAKASKTAKSGEKRRADIVLDDGQRVLKKPTRLGPILSERFSGVCAGARPS